MKSSLTKEDQIKALVEGRVHDLLRRAQGEGGVDERVVDVRPYLTVTRGDVEEFLKTHPDVAQDYFRRHSAAAHVTDSFTIVEANGRYVVAWNDHGTPASEQFFDTLAEAVAYRVLANYGMAGSK